MVVLVWQEKIISLLINSAFFTSPISVLCSLVNPNLCNGYSISCLAVAALFLFWTFNSLFCSLNFFGFFPFSSFHLKMWYNVFWHFYLTEWGILQHQFCQCNFSRATRQHLSLFREVSWLCKIDLLMKNLHSGSEILRGRGKIQSANCQRLR